MSEEISPISTAKSVFLVEPHAGWRDILKNALRARGWSISPNSLGEDSAPKDLQLLEVAVLQVVHDLELIVINVDPCEGFDAWDLASRLHLNPGHNVPIAILSFLDRETLLRKKEAEDEKTRCAMNAVLNSIALHDNQRGPVELIQLPECLQDLFIRLQSICSRREEGVRAAISQGVSELQPPVEPESFSPIPKWRFIVIDDWLDVPLASVHGNPLPNRIKRIKELAAMAGCEIKPLGGHFARRLFDQRREGPPEEIEDADLDAVFVDLVFGEGKQGGVDLSRLGLEIIRLIHEWRPEIPVFALSVKSDPGALVEAIQHGAQWYFAKYDPGNDEEKDFLEAHWSQHGHGQQRLGLPETELERTLSAYYFRSTGESEGCDAIRDFLEDRIGFEEQVRKVNQWEETSAILRALFKGCSRLCLVKAPVSGYSANWAVFVRPERRAPGGGPNVRDNVKLVKIGNRFDMRNEKKGFDSIIDGYVDNFLGIVRNQYAEAGDLAGIVYSSVGPSRDYIPGKERFPKGLGAIIRDLLKGAGRPAKLPAATGAPDRIQLRTAIWREIHTHLERTYSQILEGFYRDAKRYSQHKILCEYGLLLPPLLTLSFAEAAGGGAASIDIEKLAESATTGGAAMPRWRDFKDMVTLKNGRVYETQRANHIKRAGRQAGLIRLYDRETQLKFDVRYPTGSNQLAAAQSFSLLASDPRLRRGKRLNLTGRVEGTQILDLQNKITEIPVKAQEPLKAAYGALLEPIFCAFETAAKTSESLQQFGFGGISLIEPIGFLEKRISYATRVDMTRSRIHGDLNLDNILISGDGTRAAASWLIDFAKTQPLGHTAFDFVKLEVELRTQILSDFLCNEIDREIGRGAISREDAYREWLGKWLGWEMNLPYPPPLDGNYQRQIIEGLEKWLDDGVPPEQAYLLATILSIRSLASCKVGILYEEYLYSLFFYSLAALKFPNLVDREKSASAPLPRLMAYLHAAVACSRIAKLDKQRGTTESG
jgi:CheY-like chemotaxis protein